MNIWLMQNGQQYTSARFKGGTIVVRYERHDFEGNENGAKAACNKWMDSMQVSKGLLASFFENTISQMPSGVMRPGDPEDLEGRVRELMDLQCSISDKSGAVTCHLMPTQMLLCSFLKADTRWSAAFLLTRWRLSRQSDQTR
jgi:hypothetical protein